MIRIKILDCTLRDGGYINNWKFGKKAIGNILFNIAKSNTDIIECGFLSDKPYDAERSIFNSVEQLNSFITKDPDSDTMYVAMIAIGEKELDPSYLADAEQGPLDGIRLTFHPDCIDKAFKWAEVIMSKGYKLFMQPVGTTNYTDKQFLDLLERVNELKPYAFYIVDTLGVMYKKDLLRQVILVDNNLAPEIKLGYHSHNNLQLAFSNAQALAEYKTDRDVIIDCSVNGIGRGAGNLCSELFMDYLNKNHSAHYDVLPVLEIVEQYLAPIYIDTPWGYSSAYFLSAANNCHPNYSSYLMAKHTLSMPAIGNILEQLPRESRRFFDKGLIEGIYQSYQANAVDDMKTVGALRKEWDGKNILVLAPGRSITEKKELILDYVKQNSPYIISVNFIPDYIKSDLVFVGNGRRCRELADELDVKKTVFTSNIKNLPEGATVVNYSELINASYDASDSSGIMILKLLIKASVQSVALAGYDGFSASSRGNYFDIRLSGIYDPQSLCEKNLAARQQLDMLSEKLKIKFITPSAYESGDCGEQ